MTIRKCDGCLTTANNLVVRRRISAGARSRIKEFEQAPTGWSVRAWGGGAGLLYFCPDCHAKVSSGLLKIDSATGSVR